MKKILVVVESIDVDDSSGSKTNVALINNLKQAGYEMLVYHYNLREILLTGIPCIAIKEKKENYSVLIQSARAVSKKQFEDPTA